MEIGPLDHGTQMPSDADRVRQTRNGFKREPEEVADTIEISLKARALLAQQADENLAEEVKRVSSRLGLIREKAVSGHYDRPEIIEAVADKLADLMY